MDDGTAAQAERLAAAMRQAPPFDYAAALEAQRKVVNWPRPYGFETANAAAPPPEPMAQMTGELWLWQIPMIRRVEWDARQKGHDVRLEVGPGWLIRPFVLKGPRTVIAAIYRVWKAEERVGG